MQEGIGGEEGEPTFQDRLFDPLAARVPQRHCGVDGPRWQLGRVVCAWPPAQLSQLSRQCAELRRVRDGWTVIVTLIVVALDGEAVVDVVDGGRGASGSSMLAGMSFSSPSSAAAAVASAQTQT
jgi:hypothetical protein